MVLQGFGDCTKVCKFDALAMEEDGLPHVNYDNARMWSLCRRVSAENPDTCAAYQSRVDCAVLEQKYSEGERHQNMQVGCIKCELCVKSCPEGAITMVNGIPVTDYAKCTSCGICVQKCPTKCYKMLETDVFGTKKEVPVMEDAQA
jgi:ferredoxin